VFMGKLKSGDMHTSGTCAVRRTGPSAYHTVSIYLIKFCNFGLKCFQFYNSLVRQARKFVYAFKQSGSPE
jgi:hypothetical protein